jgi:hypothetical protein
MPVGIGIRSAAGRLDLELGLETRLSNLEAVCRVRGADELTATAWRQDGAAWVAHCGPVEIRLQSRTRDGGVALMLTALGLGSAIVDAVGLRGEPVVAGGAPTLLVENGYQSWDDSVVRRRLQGQASRVSWWTAGLGANSGAGLAIAARSARRHGTVFEWQPESGLTVLQMAAPTADEAAHVWRARSGARFAAESVVAVAAPELPQALRAAAGTIRGDRVAAPRGWLSWYQHGPSVTRDDVLESAAELRSDCFADLDARVVQIDDGWQESYGDWVPNTKFAGLDLLCAELRSGGQLPGIWTAPFLVSVGSDLSDRAPNDWFVPDVSTGAPLVDPRHFVFGPMRVLDARRPAVRDHLETTFRRLRGHGFGYFKIDFLYAGAYVGFAAFRAALRAIRRGIGDDAYLLACGAPLLAVAGLVDGCRIGPDTCTPFYDFETGVSTPTFFGDEVQAVARAVAMRRHLSGWFQLDPDVAMAAATLEPGRARQLVTAVALGGGLYFLGDALAALPPDRRDLLTNPEIATLSQGGAATADLAATPDGGAPSVWRRDDGLIALFNWTGSSVRYDAIAPAGTPMRDLWRPEVVGPGPVEVPPHDVRVLRLGRGRL